MANIILGRAVNRTLKNSHFRSILLIPVADSGNLMFVFLKNRAVVLKVPFSIITPK